jgi:putative ABC transport system permease protein
VISAAQTARHAVRRLLRAPAFTVAACLTLMLGIGATTAVFSVVNAVLLKPLSYQRPEQLVDLSHTLTVSGVSRVDQSDGTYLYYRRANRVFTDVAAYRVLGVNVGRLAGAAPGETRAQRVMAARVTASVFNVLGAAPLRGRSLTENDDRPGAAPVVVLGQRLWERQFGRDEAIVGRRLDVNGVAREIIGVMPANFQLPETRTELWLPLGLDPANTATAAFDYRGVARLRDGVTLGAAATDLQRLLPHVPEAFPGRLTAGAITQIHMKAIVRPLRDVVVGDVGRVLWVVLGAVACVLLIACANVMNLFLVRAEARQHELAVRRALGAGRAAIVAEFLSEGFVLAVAGGALALGLAFVGTRVLRSLEGEIDIPRLTDVGVDGAVLALTAGITILAAFLVSAIPALRSTSVSTSAMLAEAGRSATTGRKRHRARHMLVVVQMALALVLLTGAGLMARSFARLRSVQPGFDAAHAFTFRVALPSAAYPTSGDAARLIARALDGLAALPGVKAAGVVSKLPLVDEARRDTALFVEDQPLAMGGMPNVHQVAYASPGYFVALGIPLIEGRSFEALDPARAPREIIVSRSIAARYWGGVRVVGKRARMGPVGDWFTIVGVAGDVHGSGLDQPADETIYLPLVTDVAQPKPNDSAAQPMLWTPREIAFVTRTDRDPASVAAQVERAIRAIDPGVPAYGAHVMSDVVARSAARTTFTLMLLGIASAVALVLGAVGIYGVISYIVSLRGREVAVRLALGARPMDVRRLVSRQAMGLAALGIGVGVVGAIAVTRVLAALLFGISPTDPFALAGAVVVLFAVAVLASWVPARRASQVDPARALRAE